MMFDSNQTVSLIFKFHNFNQVFEKVIEFDIRLWEDCAASVD